MSDVSEWVSECLTLYACVHVCVCMCAGMCVCVYAMSLLTRRDSLSECVCGDVCDVGDNEKLQVLSFHIYNQK